MLKADTNIVRILIWINLSIEKMYVFSSTQNPLDRCWFMVNPTFGMVSSGFSIL